MQRLRSKSPPGLEEPVRPCEAAVAGEVVGVRCAEGGPDVGLLVAAAAALEAAGRGLVSLPDRLLAPGVFLEPAVRY